MKADAQRMAIRKTEPFIDVEHRSTNALGQRDRRFEADGHARGIFREQQRIVGGHQHVLVQFGQPFDGGNRAADARGQRIVDRHIDPETDHRPTSIVRLPAGRRAFDENAGELPAFVQHVVGPLQRKLQVEHRKRFGNRHAGRQQDAELPPRYHAPGLPLLSILFKVILIAHSRSSS